MTGMKITQRTTIIGVKKFKGSIDGGAPLDFTKIITLAPMDETTGNNLGMTTAEYRFGSSANFALIASTGVPIEADLQMEITSNGRTQKINVINVVPIKAKVQP